MKKSQALSVSFLLLFASYASYADRALPGSSPEGFRIEDDLKTAIPDLPASVHIYDPDGKASGFEVKNPDGIGAFRFGDKCLLKSGSPVKFLASAIPTESNGLHQFIYVEYTGGTPDPHLNPIQGAFCPEHALVVMPLRDYLAFHRIESRIAEEKQYMRNLLESIKSQGK